MTSAPLVLIVDDDPDNREAYVEYLRFRGFRTIEAANGAEAIRLADEHQPDVILLDLRMPEVDGLEVNRYVRRHPALQHTKLIVVSACVYPADVKEAFESGCHAFLQKPCLPDALVAEMERLLAEKTPARSDTRG